MKVRVEDKEFSCMLDHDQILRRISLLGIQINVDYEDKVPVFIGVLNGSFLFMADLMKEVTIPAELSFVKVASYHGEDTSSGVVKEMVGLDIDIKGRDVIIVEDIVETGITLTYLLDMINKLEPASVCICTLLLKPESLQRQFDCINYVGFEIPNEFVVGYGLDYKGLGRNLKDIYRVIGNPTESN